MSARNLKPKVFCLSILENTGAGHPDFGLFAGNQIQRGEPQLGQMPERGVIESKKIRDDAWLTAASDQVSDYFEAYRLVIVTNFRDFLILGEGVEGRATKLESFRLAANASAFWEMVATPKQSAQRIGRAFGEYLKRALTQSVALREPKDVAWFIASYARDALKRVEEAGQLPALASVRASLEEALGVTFEVEEGAHFFRSTLVQLFFMASFQPGSCGRVSRRVRLSALIGGPQSGISRCLSSVRCSNSLRAPHISSRFSSLKYSTGQPRRSIGSTQSNSSGNSTTPKRCNSSTSRFSKPFVTELRKELGVSVHADRGSHLYGGAGR